MAVAWLASALTRVGTSALPSSRTRSLQLFDLSVLKVQQEFFSSVAASVNEPPELTPKFWLAERSTLTQKTPISRHPGDLDLHSRGESANNSISTQRPE